MGAVVSRHLLWIAASVASLVIGHAPQGAALQIRTVTPSNWERVTFAPLPIPGTDQHMDVRVSQEVIVGTGNDRAYQPIGAGGTTEPAFLRFDLEWSALNDAGCRPVPMPAPIADGKSVNIALRYKTTVEASNDTAGWLGVSNACGTTWFITRHFPVPTVGLDEAWFEVRAAGRTYWVELPYGLARPASEPAVDDRVGGDAVLPAAVRSLTERDVLVPWVAVRYAIDGRGVVDMVDACDGVATVTLSDTTRWTIDRPPIAAEIHRRDGSVFKGREISRSIGPRQSVFDFKSRGAARSRTWDDLWIDVDGARTIVTLPSSLYLLGHRLASWGDLHRLPVPGVQCKD
jgi:hypothetical protein